MLPRRWSAEVDERMDPVLQDIFRKEAAGHVSIVRDFISRCEPGAGPFAVTEALYRACHTLSGIAKTAGVRQGIKVAEPMEHYIGKLHECGHGLPEEGVALLRDTARSLENVVAHIDEDTGFFPDQRRLIVGWHALERALDTELASLAQAAERTVSTVWSATEPSLPDVAVSNRYAPQEASTPGCCGVLPRMNVRPTSQSSPRRNPASSLTSSLRSSPRPSNAASATSSQRSSRRSSTQRALRRARVVRPAGGFCRVRGAQCRRGAQRRRRAGDACRYGRRARGREWRGVHGHSRRQRDAGGIRSGNRSNLQRGSERAARAVRCRARFLASRSVGSRAHDRAQAVAAHAQRRGAHGGHSRHGRPEPRARVAARVARGRYRDGHRCGDRRAAALPRRAAQAARRCEQRTAVAVGRRISLRPFVKLALRIGSLHRRRRIAAPTCRRFPNSRSQSPLGSLLPNPPPRNSKRTLDAARAVPARRTDVHRNAAPCGTPVGPGARI